MANSMTNSVRTHMGYQTSNNTDDGHNNVSGTSYVIETFVEVRWEWLSLLAGLVVLASVFFVVTMVKSSMSKVEVMKSGALGTFNVLGTEGRSYMGPTALQHGSIKRAKGLRLRLKKGDAGWRLDA